MPRFQYGLLEPVNFVNRREEIRTLAQRIREALDGGGGRKHFIISALRRLGKTQLLKAVIRDLAGSRIPSVYLDVLAVRSPQEFITKLGNEVRKIDRNLWRQAREIVRPIRGFRPSVQVGTDGTLTISGSVAVEHWKSLGDHVFTRLAQLSRPPVIILDEMGFVRKMAGSVEEKGEFLAYLREKITETPALFVLCGSQNIFQILKEEDPNHFGTWSNIFDRFPLRPFTYEQLAKDLYEPNIRDEGLQIAAEDIEPLCRFVFSITGGHPNMAQAIGERLRDRFKEAAQVLRKDLERFFPELLPNLIFQDALGFIRSLVDKEAFGPRFKSYKALLAAIAAYSESPDLTGFIATRLGDQQETTEMVRLLEEMQYLEITEDSKIRFVCPFLRDFLAPLAQRDEVKRRWIREWRDCVSSYGG